MRQIRVLLVDDNMVFQAAAADFLHWDARIKIVGQTCDGGLGVRLARALAPDLVLMDLDMPGMDGLEATLLIKTSATAPYVAIVSQHEEPEYRRCAAAAGADAFIPKSQFSQVLPALLETWFFGPPQSLPRPAGPSLGAE